VDGAGLDWSKLVSIATNRAPAMCSEKIGLVGLLKNKLKEIHAVSTSTIHCIIHQEALCGKHGCCCENSEFYSVKKFEQQTVHCFPFHHGKWIWCLLYRTYVKWLSRGNMLKRLFALREEIALFVVMKDIDAPELCDPTFIANLAFWQTIWTCLISICRDLCRLLLPCMIVWSLFNTNCLFGQNT